MRHVVTSCLTFYTPELLGVLVPVLIQARGLFSWRRENFRRQGDFLLLWHERYNDSGQTLRQGGAVHIEWAMRDINETTAPFERLERLLYVYEKLAQGERNILLVLANRIYAGQRLHGPLTRDKKDWPYEALEEHLDSCVYMACALEAKSALAYANSVSDAEDEVIRSKEVSPDTLRDVDGA